MKSDDGIEKQFEEISVLLAELNKPSKMLSDAVELSNMAAALSLKTDEVSSTFESLQRRMEGVGKNMVRPKPLMNPAPELPRRETKEQRQQRRYQMCLDAGLKMPDNDYKYLPRGIGAVAEQEGIRRSSFTQDVKAHINRLSGR